MANLLIMLMVLAGCTAPSHFPWKDIPAPGGRLIIEYNEPPAFGPHTLHFSYLPEGQSESQNLGKRELNNDGANLGDHNLQVLETTDTSMRFVLRGQQQADLELNLILLEGKAQILGE